MPENRENTAILIFIRNSEEEARHKVFSRNIGFKGNRKIADQLNRQIIKISHASGVPSFIYNSSKQVGSTFGERLVNAFKALFQKGYDNVIAVGNDCLTLTSDHLSRAKELLSIKNIVLGPTQDGGFYLIGLSKTAFFPDQLKKLAWETPLLQQEFDHYTEIHDFNTAYFGKALDADNCCEFGLILRMLDLTSDLRMKLERILASFQRQLIEVLIGFKTFLHSNYYSLRAPPQ